MIQSHQEADIPRIFFSDFQVATNRTTFENFLQKCVQQFFLGSNAADSLLIFFRVHEKHSRFDAHALALTYLVCMSKDKPPPLNFKIFVLPNV